MLLRSLDNPASTRFLSCALPCALQPGADDVLTQHRPLRAFLLKPLTGRTHQLRVAMKSLGSPVQRPFPHPNAPFLQPNAHHVARGEEA